MPRDPEALMEDIQRRCERVVRFSEDLPRDAFFDDVRNVDAALYNLLVIGEAVKNLPDRFRREHGDRIPFDAIAGARDVFVHEYFRVDPDLLWEIVNSRVPALLREIRRLRERMSGE